MRQEYIGKRGCQMAIGPLNPAATFATNGQNTNHRRETISSHWGQNIAILLGDYIFATSARFVCDTESIRVIKRFSETIMELSSGQIMEFFSILYNRVPLFLCPSNL